MISLDGISVYQAIFIYKNIVPASILKGSSRDKFHPTGLENVDIWSVHPSERWILGIMSKPAVKIKGVGIVA